MMWHIKCTQLFYEEYGRHFDDCIPNYMRYTYIDENKCIIHWHHKWIAPFIRLIYRIKR